MTTTEVREPLTYEKVDKHSYFFDLVASRNGNEDSAERLRRHAIDVRISPEIRSLSREGRYGDSDGVAVPPLYVLEAFKDRKRSGYLGLIHTQQLPPGTDSIRGPKIALTDSDERQSYQADVVTIEGRQSATYKALSESAVKLDHVLVADLVGAYLCNVGLQVVNGSGEGEYLGIRNVPGIVRARVPAPILAYTRVGGAIAQFYHARLDEPEVLVVHPRLQAAWRAEHGHDQLHGFPTEAEMLLPALGREDVIHMVRSSDFLRWESGVRVDVDVEDEVATFKLYASSAFTAERHPSSVVELTGRVAEYLPL